MDFNNKRTWGPNPKYNLVKNYKRPREHDFIILAGPCSIESEEHAWEMAEIVSRHGATHFRGGVFRAGTYPGDAFGLCDEKILKAHRDSSRAYGMKNVMEVLDYSPTAMAIYNEYADCFQIGSRQMQNYTLLKKVAELGKPVFLKRNQGSTLDECLGACEYLLKYSSNLCDPVIVERGSSTFLNHVRWDLSISMIPAIKNISEIPIIVDGSHGTGRRDLVEPMTLAGVAAGSNGLLCEVHSQPDKRLSDSEQAIDPKQFEILIKRVNKIKKVLEE